LLQEKKKQDFRRASLRAWCVSKATYALRAPRSALRDPRSALRATRYTLGARR